MDNKSIIERYIPIVDFIAAIMGDNCEVVLHDITNPENSIIAIKNGHLSGRKVGGPLTDWVLKVIQNKSYRSQNFVSNYKASAKLKTFSSSSFFIKNDQEEIIGVVKHLNSKGAFHLKGSVSNIARAIEVSEPTVYRYLNKLRE